MGGAARDHNTERGGKEGLAMTSTGSIGQMRVVEVEGEVADEIAIFGVLPVSRMGVLEAEVGLERPSEGVHGRLQFGRGHRSISIYGLRSVSRADHVQPGQRAMLRWCP